MTQQTGLEVAFHQLETNKKLYPQIHALFKRLWEENGKGFLTILISNGEEEKMFQQGQLRFQYVNIELIEEIGSELIKKLLLNTFDEKKGILVMGNDRKSQKTTILPIDISDIL